MNEHFDIRTPPEYATADEKLRFLDTVVDAIAERIAQPEMTGRIYFENEEGLRLFCKMYVNKDYRHKKRFQIQTRLTYIITVPKNKLKREEHPYIEITKT